MPNGHCSLTWIHELIYVIQVYNNIDFSSKNGGPDNRFAVFILCNSIIDEAVQGQK